MSREEAYRMVQENAMAAWEEPALTFRERVRSDPRVTGRLIPEVLESCFDAARQLSHVAVIFGRVGLDGP
jgi:adenylosuccinate lyase